MVSTMGCFWVASLQSLVRVRRQVLEANLGWCAPGKAALSNICIRLARGTVWRALLSCCSLSVFLRTAVCLRIGIGGTMMRASERCTWLSRHPHSLRTPRTLGPVLSLVLGAPGKTPGRGCVRIPLSQARNDGRAVAQTAARCALGEALAIEPQAACSILSCQMLTFVKKRLQKRAALLAHGLGCHIAEVELRLPEMGQPAAKRQRPREEAA